MSRRNKRDLKKLKLRNSTRVSLVLISLIVFAISSASFLKSFSKEDINNIEEDVYTYKNEYNLDYTVNIKKNQFVTEESLPSGQTYVADLIDSLDMKINYKYSGSKESSIKYNYKIDAIIGASYTDDGKTYNVWDKTYNLKTSDSMCSDNSIYIDENVNVNYKNYHQEVKNFKQTMGMTLDSYLYIKLTVNTFTTVEHQEVNNEYVSDFSITVGDKIAVVDGKNEDMKIDSIKQSNAVSVSKVHTPSLICNFIIMMICLYIISYITFKTRKSNRIKNEFKLELNRILKACQDRIVIVKKEIEKENEEIVDVNNFGELIKLSEELYKPILCWISDDINNEKASFYVISNKIIYRFILEK